VAFPSQCRHLPRLLHYPGGAPSLLQQQLFDKSQTSFIFSKDGLESLDST